MVAQTAFAKKRQLTETQSKSHITSASSFLVSLLYYNVSHLPVDLQITRLFHDLLQFLVNLCTAGEAEDKKEKKSVSGNATGSAYNLRCQMRDLTHKWSGLLSVSFTHTLHVDP